MQTEYRIVRATEPITLEERVNAAIAEGWSPQGGPAICPTLTPVCTWAQAMTRTETPQRKPARRAAKTEPKE